MFFDCLSAFFFSIFRLFSLALRTLLFFTFESCFLHRLPARVTSFLIILNSTSGFFKDPLRKLSVTRSLAQSVTWSFGQSVSRSFGHSAIRSLGQSVTRSLAHLVTRSVVHSLSRLLGHSVIRSIGHSVKRFFVMPKWLKRSKSKRIEAKQR
jgi:hypothetical protein